MLDNWSDILSDDLKKLAEITDSSSSSHHTTELIPGERREVAILFMDLEGFTSLSETLDHEEVHKIVNGIMKAMARIVEGYGGYVDKFEGDKIMALFGAVEAAENDSVRAVSAGIKMRDTMSEINDLLSSKNIKLSCHSYGR